MGYFYYIVFWGLLIGGIAYMCYKLFRNRSGKNTKGNSSDGGERISNYGGPDIELPPGISRPSEDKQESSKDPDRR